jgi:hypothetical protein
VASQPSPESQGVPAPEFRAGSGGPSAGLPCAEAVIQCPSFNGGSIRAVELTKRQRNQVFETLIAEGVDPAACKVSTQLLSHIEGEIGRLAVWHRPSGSHLTIRERLMSDRFRVDSWIPDGPDEESDDATWDQVLSHIAQWAQDIVYVTETPDFWTELQQVPKILAAAQTADASNAPFTPDEQAEIGRRLDEVKQLVRDQFELTDEQLALDRVDVTPMIRHCSAPSWAMA